MRHNYTALTSSLVTSRTSDKVIFEVVKMIRKEMKEICSLKHNSLLRTSDDSIDQFSFNEVQTELMQKVSTLMTIMSAILKKKSIKKPLLYLISVMHLKKRFSKMSHIKGYCLFYYMVMKQVNRYFIYLLRNFKLIIRFIPPCKPL